jgi:hypothetical protein
MNKIMEMIEKIKDAVLPAPTYRIKVVRFKDQADFFAKLMRGDVVVAKDAAATVGLVGGSEHEVEAASGGVLSLKGGKKLLAEWFRPEVRRRVRVRTKADLAIQRQFAENFARDRWDSFSAQIDQRIAKAKTDVAESEAAIQRAQNILRMRQDNVVRLEASKVSGDVWPRALADRLMGLVESKLFTNIEMVAEGDNHVLIAYTGPMEVLVKDGQGQRGEYAIKVFPFGAPTRIVIENVMPGHLASDVPFNENSTGMCNVCFGDQRAEMQAMIDEEDWVRLLTLIRVYLEGNRRS